MKAAITRLWLSESKFPNEVRIEIRADFDNDRHFAVLVDQPHDAHAVAFALANLANMIGNDPVLNRRTPDGGA